MYIHSDRLTSLSQSTALGTKHPAQHKAPHSAYTPAECLKHAAQATPKGLALHALCLVTKTCLDVVIRKIDEHQNHHYMLCEVLSDA